MAGGNGINEQNNGEVFCLVSEELKAVTEETFILEKGQEDAFNKKAVYDAKINNYDGQSRESQQKIDEYSVKVGQNNARLSQLQAQYAQSMRLSQEAADKFKQLEAEGNNHLEEARKLEDLAADKRALAEQQRQLVRDNNDKKTEEFNNPDRAKSQRHLDKANKELADLEKNKNKFKNNVYNSEVKAYNDTIEGLKAQLSGNSIEESVNRQFEERVANYNKLLSEHNQAFDKEKDKVKEYKNKITELEKNKANYSEKEYDDKLKHYNRRLDVHRAERHSQHSKVSKYTNKLAETETEKQNVITERKNGINEKITTYTNDLKNLMKNSSKFKDEKYAEEKSRIEGNISKYSQQLQQSKDREEEYSKAARAANVEAQKLENEVNGLINDARNHRRQSSEANAGARQAEADSTTYKIEADEKKRQIDELTPIAEQDKKVLDENVEKKKISDSKLNKYENKAKPENIYAATKKQFVKERQNAEFAKSNDIDLIKAFDFKAMKMENMAPAAKAFDDFTRKNSFLRENIANPDIAKAHDAVYKVKNKNKTEEKHDITKLFYIEGQSMDKYLKNNVKDYRKMSPSEKEYMGKVAIMNAMATGKNVDVKCYSMADGKCVPKVASVLYPEYAGKQKDAAWCAEAKKRSDTILKADRRKDAKIAKEFAKSDYYTVEYSRPEHPSKSEIAVNSGRRQTDIFKKQVLGERSTAKTPDPAKAVTQKNPEKKKDEKTI